MAIKIRRGLEANRTNITPTEGELLYTTDNKKVFIGDGSTAGGIPLTHSATEMLTDLLTVDGVGSGLDADVIDGIEGSQIVRADTDTTFSGTLTVENLIVAELLDTPNSNSVVDVFVYDTAKDSDGGAWRKRTQHTSWYNETLNTATRGATKEFPAIAIIVTETTKVTIYDATDASVPMWMEFNISGGYMIGPDTANRYVHMLNGQLRISTYFWALSEIDFIADYSQRRTNTVIDNTGQIANRNISGTQNPITIPASDKFINIQINDVDMIVTDDAPISIRNGLPIPTVAVATVGGAHVILPNESTYSLTHTINVNNESGHVQFYKNGIRWSSRNSGGYVYVQVLNNIPMLDSSDAPDHFYSYTNQGAGQQINLAFSPNGGAITRGFANNAIGSTNGLTLLEDDTTNDIINDNRINYITKDYQSGWMVGDIKGAFLSSIDATSLVGSGELTSNTTDWTGAAGSTPPTGWSSTGTPLFSVSSTQLTIDRNGENDVTAVMTQTLNSLTIGTIYAISIDVIDDGASNALSVGVDGTVLLSNADTGSYIITFTATATSHVLFIAPGGTITNVAIVDNLSFKRADDNRSHLETALSVEGTITRTAVETGAELVGYTGFTTSDYLAQAYNPDLDFGTGDFYVMMWVKNTGPTLTYALDRANAVGDNRFAVILHTTGIQFFTNDESGGASAFNTTFGSLDTFGSEWTFVCARRESSGNSHVTINDNTVSTLNTARNVSVSTGSKLTVGIRYAITNPTPASISLIRIGAGMPTDAQIKAIYETERKLFNENAACTLTSNTDDMRALAYDDTTNLLHVAGATNLDTFNGLVRVDSTAGVFTSLSAANNIVVKGN